MKLADIATLVLMEKLLIRIRNASDEEILEMWGGKFSRSQTAAKIRADACNPDMTLTETSYRPFDGRWVYFTGQTDGMITCPRREVMKNLVYAPGNPVFYCNRVNPQDRYSKPIDFERYDEQLLPHLDASDPEYFRHHPYFAPVFGGLLNDIRERDGVSLKEAAARLADHWSDIEVSTGTHPDQRSDEPRLPIPISMYNLGRYPSSPEEMARVVESVRSGDYWRREHEKAERRQTKKADAAERLAVPETDSQPERRRTAVPRRLEDGASCRCEMCTAKGSVFGMFGLLESLYGAAMERDGLAQMELL